MTPGSLPKTVAVPKSQKSHISLLNTRNSEPSVLNHEIFYLSPKTLVHDKIPVKTKITFAVFQCTSLGEFVFSSQHSHCVAISGRVWLASHIKHPTSSRKRPVYLRPSSSGFVLPELTHISRFTANAVKIYQMPQCVTIFQS